MNVLSTVVASSIMPPSPYELVPNISHYKFNDTSAMRIRVNLLKNGKYRIY